MFGTILAKVLQLIDIVALLMYGASKVFGTFNVTGRQLAITLTVTLVIEVVYVVVDILRRVYKD